MTVEAPPGASPARTTSERRPPTRRTRGKRVAVLYNVDYEDAPSGDPAFAARAQVGEVAEGIAAALGDGGYDPHLVPVDGDLPGLRARLGDLDPDCAFNLCESLANDAR